MRDALTASSGDWTAAAASLTDKLQDDSLQKVTLAHSLAVWLGDNVSLVSTLANKPNVSRLRDVALNYYVEKLTVLVDPKNVLESIAGATDDEKKRNFAVALQHELFALEPTAVLQRMVQEAEVPIANTSTRTFLHIPVNHERPTGRTNGDTSVRGYTGCEVTFGITND